jgi:hypothetical protein
MENLVLKILEYEIITPTGASEPLLHVNRIKKVRRVGPFHCMARKIFKQQIETPKSNKNYNNYYKIK